MSKETTIELEGSYRHVLRLAAPLIVSTSSFSIMHFVDRMFVAWYSQDALAASAPAGAASFIPAAFFIGTAGYVSTFVAQYSGAGRNHRIGPAVWQGIYLGLAAMVLMWTLYPLAEPIMNLGGHDLPIRVLEIKYFRVLVLGAGFVVLNAALNGFYTGRGKMYTVMAVSFVINIANIALNYCWIFGKFGFPAWGLVGAGWATVLSQGLGVGIMFVLFFSPTNRRQFATTTQIRLDKDLFKRLLRYGVPNGLHFCVDVSAFTVFLFIVGWKGPTALATTNAVFSINQLAFMPMIGFAIATSTLVGQFLGRKRPDLAQRSTSAALRMVLLYMCLIAAVFLVFPEQLLGVFKSHQGNTDASGMIELGKVLLIFVALYSLVDGVAIVYAAALKGAGDTLFILLMTGIMSWTIMVLPVYISIKYFDGDVKMAFSFVMVYVAALAGGFYLRYRGGKWKHMRVIEPVEATPLGIAEGPLVDT